jgi:hypothetical protein
MKHLYICKYLLTHHDSVYLGTLWWKRCTRQHKVKTTSALCLMHVQCSSKFKGTVRTFLKGHGIKTLLCIQIPDSVKQSLEISMFPATNDMDLSNLNTKNFRER